MECYINGIRMIYLLQWYAHGQKSLLWLWTGIGRLFKIRSKKDSELFALYSKDDYDSCKNIRSICIAVQNQIEKQQMETGLFSSLLLISCPWCIFTANRVKRRKLAHFSFGYSRFGRILQTRKQNFRMWIWIVLLSENIFWICAINVWQVLEYEVAIHFI